MAKNRYVSTKFWDDAYIETLTVEESLFFLYCLTNESLELCGIYEFSLKLASLRTKILPERVRQILQKFDNDGKMKYLNGWLAIKNFIKYQNSENGPVSKGIKRSLSVAPNALIEWVESNSIIKQNENNDNETCMSHRDTCMTPSTLLNSTLLNSKEIVEENKQNVVEPKKTTGLSFSSFCEAIEKKDNIYDFMVERCKVAYKFDKFIIERELRKFYDYWTEQGEKDRKNRQEKEKSFEVNKRIGRWFEKVKLSQKDLEEIEKAKIARKLEQSQKLFNEQKNYE